MKVKTKEQFIIDAIKVHGNKYNYSKVEYTNTETKICIICPEHGEFWQKPANHLQGKGCSECGKLLRSNSKKRTTTEFIEEANIVHNYKYNYSKTVYTKASQKIIITCPIHGDFEQRADHHLAGHGCRKCKTEENSNKRRKTLEQFIEQANKIHNSKFDYGKSIYVNDETKLIVTCPIHGDWEVTPNNHLSGRGCPICNQSKGETLVKEYLDKLKINYKEQYQITIDTTINSTGHAYIDFYLPDYNVFIEYNGEQHYKPMRFTGGILQFEHQQKRDQYVRDYCKNNNINLIEISYENKTKENIKECLTFLKESTI